MIYTIEEYREVFHASKSIRTVQRMVKANLVPSNHIIHKSGGFLIEIKSEIDNSNDYLTSIEEFQLKKQTASDYIELAATICMRNGIHLGKFLKYVGIK